MAVQKCLLIIGQLLSIVGTFGLAAWGLPQKTYDTTGNDPMLASQINEESKRAGIAGLKRHTRLARTFLWTLFAGMAVQLIATFVGP